MDVRPVGRLGLSLRSDVLLRRRETGITRQIMKRQESIVKSNGTRSRH